MLPVDWKPFRDWLLVDRDLSESYVERHQRSFNAMTAFGVDWNGLRRGGEAAKDAVRPFLADRKAKGHIHMVRNCQKALNLLAAFLKAKEPGFLPVHWDLVRQPKRSLDPYTPAEIAAMFDGTPKGFLGLRARALLFSLLHTGLRRGEVLGFRAQDFNRERRAVWVEFPEKGGRQRWVNLPDSAFHDDSHLLLYLTERDHRVGPMGAAWVTRHGTACNLDTLCSAMERIRILSGVRLNFNRFRHTKGTLNEELGISSQVQQREWDHTSEKSTGHYCHGSMENRRRVLARAGMPGYLDPGGRPALADAYASTLPPPDVVKYPSGVLAGKAGNPADAGSPTPNTSTRPKVGGASSGRVGSN